MTGIWTLIILIKINHTEILINKFEDAVFNRLRHGLNYYSIFRDFTFKILFFNYHMF